MALYTYTAQTASGDTYEKTIEAPDRFSVYTHIRKEGGTILSLEEFNPRTWQGIFETFTLYLSSVKERDKILLARNLSAMISAGLPLSRALHGLERQAKNPKLKHVIERLNEEITKGRTLYEALDQFPTVFSLLFRSMVRAGEESGKLAESLATISLQLERVYNLKKKVRGALIYPTIVLAAMFVIGILMLTYVVPTLSQTFKELNADLPLTTQVVIAVSDFLRNNILTSLLLFFMGVVLAVASLRTSRGKRYLDYVLLHIPVISEIIKEVNAARTARTLSSLLSSGVQIVTAIGITRDVVQNSYFKEVLVSAEASVQKGDELSEAFEANTHLYPVMMAEMISVGNETGNLTKMLMEVADFYENEVEQKTKDMSTVIEPFLMLVIGTGVGFFAVSMIAPIYSISNNI